MTEPTLPIERLVTLSSRIRSFACSARRPQITNLGFCILLLLASKPAVALDISAAENFSQNILPEFTYFQDVSGLLTLEDITSREFKAARITVEGQGQHLWLKLELQLLSAENEQLFLELTYFRADRIDAFLVEDGELVWNASQGNNIPFDERQLPTTSPTFSFTLSDRPSALYLRTSPGILTIASLSDSAGYLGNNTLRDQMAAATILLLISLALYWIVIYKATRNDYTLYFALHIALLSFYELIYSGFIYQITTISLSFYWHSILSTYSFALSLIFALLFISSFLSFSKYIPRAETLYRYGTYILGAILLLGISSYWLDWQLFLGNLVSAIGISFSLISFSITIYLITKGNKIAKYYLIGSLLALLATGVSTVDYYLALNATSYQSNELLVNSIYYGSVCVRNLIVALGISELFRIERNEKERAQEQALAEAHASNRMRREHNEQLEGKIQARTLEISVQNKKLEGQSRDLEKLSRERLSFFAAASHDLRQPLHAIRLFAESVESKLTDPSTSQSMAMLRKSLANMTSMFNSLLDASRIDVGVARPEFGDVFIPELFESIRQEYRGAAQDALLELRIREKLVHVHSDPVMLKRILNNLVENATKYTSKGGVLLSCRMKAEGILIQVWDTGSGMDPQQLDIAFEEFKRLKNSKGSGLGLGLSIVKKMTDLLGHSLQVSSRKNRGTVFSLLLEKSQIEKLSSFPVYSLNYQSALKIVLVDDSNEVRESTSQLLRDWGHTVTCYESKADCLERVRSNNAAVDLFLLDADLEKAMDGFALLPELRSWYSDAIFYIITGDTNNTKRDAAQLQTVPLLYKPINPAQLRSLMLSVNQKT